AILTADWHIRPTAPVCRTDDFLAAMWKKVEFILDLSDKHCAPIIIAGDIGLKSQWPNWLLEELIGRIKAKKDQGARVYAIPGQHDLPDHNLEWWRASAIGVLHESEVITFLGIDDQKYVNLNEVGLRSIFPFPFGVEIRTIGNPLGDDYPRPLIAVAHTLVTERAPESFLADKAQSAMNLLEKFQQYDLILTGDNHKPFVVEYEGRLLVNPGSLMRTTADQVDHKPRVYLWYGLENRVEPVYLPIEEDVIDRTHIDLQEAKDERIEAYVSRLSEEVEIGLSFEGNLESYFKSNRIRKPVQDKVWTAMPK
ncbi:MAG: metallophosphoesterase, partial [Ignavibacteria bacterium]|nr:metallophosphoesterase [Ignavibacteria bacterium]